MIVEQTTLYTEGDELSDVCMEMDQMARRQMERGWQPLGPVQLIMDRNAYYTYRTIQTFALMDVKILGE